MVRDLNGEEETTQPIKKERSSRRNQHRITALRIIDLCRTISEKGLDPFEVEVEDLFERLAPFYSQAKEMEELYLDIYAVLGLSNVVFHQGEWIKHRSSLLYFDPLLVLMKIESLSPEALANIFIKAWHPILELERITEKGLEEAFKYWSDLPSLDERILKIDAQEVEAETVEVHDLKRLGYLSEEEFTAALEDLWEELIQLAEEEEELSYWEFVDRDSYEQTVWRAYMVSFLVSYGYATLMINPLEEKITLTALKKRKTGERLEVSSIPISISYKEWRERRQELGRRRHS